MPSQYKNVRTPASKKFHSLSYYLRRIEVIIPKRGKDKGRIKLVYESPSARRNITLLAPIGKPHKPFATEAEARKYIRESLKDEVHQQFDLAKKAQEWRSNEALTEIVEKFKLYLEAQNHSRASMDYDHFLSALTYFVGERREIDINNWAAHSLGFSDWLFSRERLRTNAASLEWSTCRAKLNAYNKFVSWAYSRKLLSQNTPIIIENRRQIEIDPSELAEKGALIKFYFKKVRRKEDEYYKIRFPSIRTGKIETYPASMHPKFPTKEAAKKWADENYDKILVRELEYLKNHAWRAEANIVRAVEAFLKFRREMRPRSYRADYWAMDIIMSFFVGDLRIKSFTKFYIYNQNLVAHLMDGAVTRKGDPISFSSVGKCINTYNQFIKWLRSNSFISAQEVERIELPEKPISEREREEVWREGRYMSPEEIHRMETWLRNNNKENVADAMILQHHFCLRLGELVTISPKSVNLLTKGNEKLKRQIEDEGDTVYGWLVLTHQAEKPASLRYGLDFNKTSLKSRKLIGGERGTEYLPIRNEKVLMILKGLVKETFLRFDNLQGQSHPKTGEPYSKDLVNYPLFRDIHYTNYNGMLANAADKTSVSFYGSYSLRHSGITDSYVNYLNESISKKLGRHRSDKVHEIYLHIAAKIRKEGSDTDSIAHLRKLLG